MTSIVPMPRSLTLRGGRFHLEDGARIAADGDTAEVADWLQQELRKAMRFPLPRAEDGGDIRLRIDPSLEREGYRLTVDGGGVDVVGGAPAGVFYGAQVLLQLLPAEVFRSAPIAPPSAWELPCVDIVDSPRFAWRGVMLDVARHFMPKRDVLRFIDLMAMHRLNVLHLHLTDDQGWRVQIRRYPLLTEVGGWRAGSQVGPPPDAPVDGRPHGGFYTQDDIREIVAYAEGRQIEVVPEVDVPGHSRAAIAAYPELGVGVDATGVGGPMVDVAARWGVMTEVLNTEDSTVRFYRGVFDELMELFPGRYIGIGGDECPKDAWRADPRTQELMGRRGLEDEEQLQTWFMRQIADHIVARGRRPYGWDELLAGAPNARTVIASWRGMTGARTAVRRGFSVVACPDDKVYLDYRQSDLPSEPIPFAIPVTVEDVYSFEPVPDDVTPEEAALVLGGQANVWTEHMDSPRVVDYYAFPRLCAIAEVLWGTREPDYAAFESRLDAHLARLDAFGVEYRRPGGPLPWQTRPDVVGRPSTRSAHADLIAGLVADIRS